MRRVRKPLGKTAKKRRMRSLGRKAATVATAAVVGFGSAGCAVVEHGVGFVAGHLGGKAVGILFKKGAEQKVAEVVAGKVASGAAKGLVPKSEPAGKPGSPGPVPKPVKPKAVSRAVSSPKKQWPEIFKVYPSLNPSKYSNSQKRVDLINKVAGRTKLSPAEVLLSIILTGDSRAHLRALKASNARFEQDIASKGSSNLSRLYRKQELETNIKVLEALLDVKESSKQNYWLVKHTTSSVKPGFFSRGKLRQIISTGRAKP